MKNHPVCLLAAASTLLAAIASPCSSAIVRFTATINSAQETTGSDSTATGSAELLYDVTENRFDLTVTINGLANILTLSHIHEGAPGVAGGPVYDFGAAETNYTRDGNTITATFANEVYSGDPATLLAGNAYLNYHTAAWTGGEVRGQLVPDPVKLTAILTPEQEPATTPVESDAYGALQASYDPASNEISVLVCVYNFTNTFTNSHIHEAPVGVNGGVTLGFGGAAVFTQMGNTYVQFFPAQTYPGSAVNLLSEGAYYNAHSNIYAPGEIRGQLYVQDPSSRGRLVNVSARGNVGTGDQVLITGFIVNGTEPVRVLATARGPVLTSFGVSGVLADPAQAIHDSDGNLLFTNDDMASAPFGTLIADSGVGPSESAESAILLVLPPGAYTSVVSGADASTGIALAEAFELAW